MEPGQKVWFIDSVYNRVEAGKLVSPDNASDRDYHPTLMVEGKHSKIKVLTGWVFTNKREAETVLREKIRRDIQQHIEELRRLGKAKENVP